MNIGRRDFLLGASALTLPESVQGAKTRTVAMQPVPLGIAENCFLLEIALNGHALKAIVDTGASRCVIDTKLAEYLHIKTVSEQDVSFIFAGGRLGVAEKATVEIGGLKIISQPYIGDLRSRGLRYDMLIGLDVLDAIILLIDAPGLRAGVMPRIGAFNPPGARKLSLTRQKWHLMCDVALDGRSGRAQIDTGSGTPLSVREDWAARTKFLEGKRLSHWIAGDMSGLYDVTRTSAADARLAHLDFRNVPVEIHPNRVEHEVVVGMPFFERIHATWDTGGNAVWFREGQVAQDKPFTRDRSGLAYLPEGPVLRVVFVAPGSPAEKTGWKKDERIALIDGKPHTALGGDIIAWKMDPARKQAVLTLDSGEVRTLELADYY
jgi:predicted aspartyl protease